MNSEQQLIDSDYTLEEMNAITGTERLLKVKIA